VRCPWPGGARRASIAWSTRSSSAATNSARPCGIGCARWSTTTRRRATDEPACARRVRRSPTRPAARREARSDGDMLCSGRRQDTVDDAGAVEAGDDRDAPGHGGRLEAVDLLHPSDIALDVRPSRSGWVEKRNSAGRPERQIRCVGGSLVAGEVVSHPPCGGRRTPRSRWAEAAVHRGSHGLESAPNADERAFTSASAATVRTLGRW
jgi:hypothetical protein